MMFLENNNNKGDVAVGGSGDNCRASPQRVAAGTAAECARRKKHVKTSGGRGHGNREESTERQSASLQTHPLPITTPPLGCKRQEEDICRGGGLRVRVVEISKTVTGNNALGTYTSNGIFIFGKSRSYTFFSEETLSLFSHPFFFNCCFFSHSICLSFPPASLPFHSFLHLTRRSSFHTSLCLHSSLFVLRNVSL